MFAPASRNGGKRFIVAIANQFGKPRGLIQGGRFQAATRGKPQDPNRRMIRPGRTSFGLVQRNELLTGHYFGRFQGVLYADYLNEPPVEHAIQGRDRPFASEPLDADGRPSSTER